jgi:hypothetical protein
MAWQMYWKNWWKLWPYYSKSEDWEDIYGFGYQTHCFTYKVFAFGPLQIRWMTCQNCSGMGY